MEQETLNQITEEQAKESALFKVTPFSKYLALALFVALPFIGGWIGYQYAPDKIVEVEKVVISEVETEETKTTPVVSDKKIEVYSISTTKQDILDRKNINNNGVGFANAEVRCQDVVFGVGVAAEFCEEYWPGYEMVVDSFIFIEGVQHIYVVRTGINPGTPDPSFISEHIVEPASTIRVVTEEVGRNVGAYFTDEHITYTDVSVPEELSSLTQAPHLTLIYEDENKLVLTKHCFADKACRNSGLYSYDKTAQAISEMEISGYYDEMFRSTRLSPDKTAAISSNDLTMGGDTTELHYLDLEGDQVQLLGSFDLASGWTFCTGGMGGCGDIVVNWIDEKEIEVTIFGVAGSGNNSRTERYTLPF